MEIFNECYQLLDDLKSDMDTIRLVSMHDFKENLFNAILVSAFCKSYDYCFNLKDMNEDSSFMFIPFLRGICEDIICLKYLKKSIKDLKERNHIIGCYSSYLQVSSLKAQQYFFNDIKAEQASLELEDPDTVVLAYENELKKFWGNQGQNPHKLLPSTQHMAIDAQLSNLYNFLYHATSKFVHFSPNILMRLGWYNKNSPEEIINFNFNNFSKYYQQFNTFYGIYLFVIFSKTFKKDIKLGKSFLKIVSDLDSRLKDLDFYPEAVTYEEMNIERPNSIIELLIRSHNRIKMKKNN